MSTPELTVDPWTTLARFRAALVARDTATAARLVAAYRRVWDNISPQIDALAAEIAANPELATGGKLFRLTRLKSLRRQVEAEISRYGIIVDNELAQGALQSVGLAGREARVLTQSMVPRAVADRIMATWTTLPADAVVSLLGFLDDGSALRRYLREGWGKDAGQDFADKLISAVATGQNPRVTARKVLGGALTDALRVSRTVQANAYREATRANYVANERIVDQWMWSSARSPRSCCGCLAMDGKRFPVTERLEDH